MSLPSDDEAIAAWVDAGLDARPVRARPTAVWHRRALGMTTAQALGRRPKYRQLSVRPPRVEGDELVRVATRRGRPISNLIAAALGKWMVEEEGFAPEDLPWLTKRLPRR